MLISGSIEFRKHSLVLRDPDQSGAAGHWANDIIRDGVGVGRGELSFHLQRASGRAPVWIEDAEPPPSLTLAAFSHVVDAPFVHTGGPLWLETFGFAFSHVTLPLAAGRYQARIAMGNLDTCVYDHNWGVDYYYIWLWPSDSVELRVLRHHQSVYQQQAPSLSADEARRILDAGGPARFQAYPALAAQGTQEALAILQQDASDELSRNLLVAALALTQPLPYRRLAAYLNDGAVSVRDQVLITVHDVLGRAEFDECAFDVDEGYDLLNAAAQDPEIAGYAQQLLTKLDSIAAELRSS